MHVTSRIFPFFHTHTHRHTHARTHTESEPARKRAHTHAHAKNPPRTRRRTSDSDMRSRTCARDTRPPRGSARLLRVRQLTAAAAVSSGACIKPFALRQIKIRACRTRSERDHARTHAVPQCKVIRIVYEQRMCATSAADRARHVHVAAA